LTPVTLNYDVTSPSTAQYRRPLKEPLSEERPEAPLEIASGGKIMHRAYTEEKGNKSAMRQIKNQKPAWSKGQKKRPQGWNTQNPGFPAGTDGKGRSKLPSGRKESSVVYFKVG